MTYSTSFERCTLSDLNWAINVESKAITGNSTFCSLLVFKSHKSFEKKYSGLQTKIEGNKSIIRGNQMNNRNNRNKKNEIKSNDDTHMNELFDNNCHMFDMTFKEQMVGCAWFNCMQDILLPDNVQK